MVAPNRGPDKGLVMKDDSLDITSVSLQREIIKGHHLLLNMTQWFGVKFKKINPVRELYSSYWRERVVLLLFCVCVCVFVSVEKRGVQSKNQIR